MKLNEANKMEKEEYIYLIDGDFLFEIYLLYSMKNRVSKYDLYLCLNFLVDNQILIEQSLYQNLFL